MPYLKSRELLTEEQKQILKEIQEVQYGSTTRYQRRVFLLVSNNADRMYYDDYTNSSSGPGMVSSPDELLKILE